MNSDPEIKKEVEELESIVGYQGNNPDKNYLKKQVIVLLTNSETKIGYKQDLLDDIIGWYSISAIRTIVRSLI